MEVKKRFFNDPGVNYFLFGPRGTGKSTWLKVRQTSANACILKQTLK